MKCLWCPDFFFDCGSVRFRTANLICQSSGNLHAKRSTMFSSNRISEWGSSCNAIGLRTRAKPGDHVRVRNGAFQGVEGMVVSRQGTCRLIIAVDLMQTGVSLEINENRIEVV